MSELVKYDESMESTIGGSLLKVGGASAAVYGVSLLPFISLPFLIVVLVLAGLALKLKG